jgi:hypothetical protein
MPTQAESPSTAVSGKLMNDVVKKPIVFCAFDSVEVKHTALNSAVVNKNGMMCFMGSAISICRNYVDDK